MQDRRAYVQHTAHFFLPPTAQHTLFRASRLYQPPPRPFLPTHPSSILFHFSQALAGVGLDWTFAGEAESGVAQRFVALFVSIGGMLVTALMLGIVSDAIGEKMDDLRKGKSDVLESDHTLILGWSDKLLPIVKQLSIANESKGGGVIVVLAERDKEQMDSDVKEFIHSEGRLSEMGTNVICRSGNPIIISDLHKVSVATARAIIVLADDDIDPDKSDARALRIALSLYGIQEKNGLDGHVVVEVTDMDNEPLVRLVGGANVETVVSHDVIGRLMLQCARQPGLAYVFEDLLGFDHCEFYFKAWPSLAGRNFGEVIRMFEDAIPCGVYNPHSGAYQLNPPDAYLMQSDDQLLVIAEDDDSYAPQHAPVHVRTGPMPSVRVSRHAEKVLFCGWRRDMEDLVMVLDEFVRPGSELWIFCDIHVAEREARFTEGGLDPVHGLRNLKLKHEIGDTVSRKDLEQLPLVRGGPAK